MTTLAALSLSSGLLAAGARPVLAGPGAGTEARASDARPPVAVVVPARDEAPFIERTLRSLLAQDYPGPFRVILVDDRSDDGTGAIARAIGDPRLTVVNGAPRPAGWSGKLWAVAQGIAEADNADWFC